MSPIASDRRGQVPYLTTAAHADADQSTPFWVAHQQFFEYKTSGLLYEIVSFCIQLRGDMIL
jgi:hypothetical protein